MKTPKSKFSLAAILLLAFCAGAVSNSYLEVALRSLRNRVAQTSQQAPEPKPKRYAQPKHYTNRNSVVQHLVQFSSRSETSITFLGDSHIEECEWRDLWALHVDNHNPDVSIRNRGVSCSTTKQVLERLKELSKHDKGLLIIMVGVNDISLGIAPEETIANFSEMLDTCDEHKLNALEAVSKPLQA